MSEGKKFFFSGVFVFIYTKKYIFINISIYYLLLIFLFKSFDDFLTFLPYKVYIGHIVCK